MRQKGGIKTRGNVIMISLSVIFLAILMYGLLSMAPGRPSFMGGDMPGNFSELTTEEREAMMQQRMEGMNMTGMENFREMDGNFRFQGFIIGNMPYIVTGAAGFAVLSVFFVLRKRRR